MPKLSAKWIWHKQDDYRAYNRTILARKTFEVPAAVKAATVRISADSYYRLHVNGRWVANGPCRAWPEHYQYDEIDVSGYLQQGRNEIEVVARYFGCGTFHEVPQHAGLLVELDARLAGGKRLTVLSDRTWQTAAARQWKHNTTKISVQQPPTEVYDARLAGVQRWSPAVELFDADAGPWKGLHPRDVRLLTRQPVAIREFVGAKVVRKPVGTIWTLASSNLANPGRSEANALMPCPGGMATILKLTKPATIELGNTMWLVHVNGREGRDGKFRLPAGRHVVVAITQKYQDHGKQRILIVDLPAGAKLINPIDAAHENPWCYLPTPEGQYVSNDMVWPIFRGDVAGKQERFVAWARAKSVECTDVKSFRRVFGDRARLLPIDEMFLDEETQKRFDAREVLADARELVADPMALAYDNAEYTEVRPSPSGDVELCYDLGKQSVGYWQLDLIAPAGTIVDFYGVEYISPDGRIQHTYGYRNTLRYIAAEGVNRFTSLQRRSQRFVFLTLRDLTGPVRIRRVGLVESTYPVARSGRFECSDERLAQVWDISARTLKLCMEDTFTDCPLYEQTLWVGDARNESLFAYWTFGAYDLARRCIELAAQSLERYPMVGCQVPSSWDCLLPAWSFLWGISVWDYYFHTGDAKFLRRIWPAVRKNLRGAETFLDDRGLFTSPTWNIFDWSGADQMQRCVLHNSMLTVGAVNAALDCAKVLADRDSAAELRGLRKRLCASINACWDAKRSAWPDSFHLDGKPSESTCQHTSFLALLYDIVSGNRSAAAKRNVLSPPEDMVRVGSPFAILYLYECLEKLGRPDDVLQSIRENYLPMLDAGATTVWEVFPTSKYRPEGFPTRSHSHAWSSAPLHFLPRIVLGIRPTKPAFAAVDVSPRLSGLTWARGSVPTPHGPLSVEWKLDGKKLSVTIDAPKGVKARLVPNETHKGLVVDP